MANQRQMVVLTLKDLTRQCLHEQIHLKMLGRSRREIEQEERQARNRIKMIKLKVNREILAHSTLLGVDLDAMNDDGDGEEWKEHA